VYVIYTTPTPFGSTLVVPPLVETDGCGGRSKEQPQSGWADNNINHTNIASLALLPILRTYKDI